MNVAVFLPNWIGDVAMATPTLRALREHLGPGASLIGVMRPYVADVLAGTNWLDETWLYDRRAADPEQRSWPLVRRMRQRRIDLAVLLTNSLSTALVAWAGGARRRIGYARYWRGPLLTHKLQPPREGHELKPTSAVDYYLAIATALGCADTSRRMELQTTLPEESLADAAWQRLGLPPGEQVVVLNSSGAYGAAKHWPVEYCADLARRIVDELQLSVLVLCGPAESDSARRVVQLADRAGVVSLAEQPLSIGLSKACLRRSRLLVTTDSGPRHLAAAFGVPHVALFGPTDPRWSDTYSDNATLLWREVPCGPCARRVCPLGHHRCMTELTVAEVFAAVERQTKKSVDGPVANRVESLRISAG